MPCSAAGSGPAFCCCCSRNQLRAFSPCRSRARLLLLLPPAALRGLPLPPAARRGLLTFGGLLHRYAAAVVVCSRACPVACNARGTVAAAPACKQGGASVCTAESAACTKACSGASPASGPAPGISCWTALHTRSGTAGWICCSAGSVCAGSSAPDTDASATCRGW